MSSKSDSSKGVAKLPDGDTAGQEIETKEDTETMNKCEVILTKLESCFSALMNAIMGKFGQQLSGIFKDSLECAICKELIVEAVSRRCTHTFCYHCFTTWLEKSKECPICRDSISLGMKNPLIDEVIQLLVDLSLTEEEKKERTNLTQQRSASTPTVGDEILVVNNGYKIVLEAIGKDDLVLICRFMCAKKMKYFLSEIRGSEQFQKLMNDSKEEDRTSINSLVNTFESDVINWNSLLESIPESLDPRYRIELAL